MVGLVARVSNFCMCYRVLEFCGLCMVLSAALSILERIADALEGRADNFDAFGSMECVFKQVLLVILACDLIILLDLFVSRF
jgi:hypothetical protein